MLVHELPLEVLPGKQGLAQHAAVRLPGQSILSCNLTGVEGSALFEVFPDESVQTWQSTWDRDELNHRLF